MNVEQSVQDYGKHQAGVVHPLHDLEECHQETGELVGWPQLEPQDAVAGVIVGKPLEAVTGGEHHTVATLFHYSYHSLQTHYFSSHLTESALSS